MIVSFWISTICEGLATNAGGGDGDAACNQLAYALVGSGDEGDLGIDLRFLLRCCRA